MLVLVPQDFVSSDYGNDKHALKIMSLIVCGSLKNCIDYRNNMELSGKPSNPDSLLGSWSNIDAKAFKAIASGYHETCVNLERDGWIEVNRHANGKRRYSNYADNKYPQSFRLQSNWRSNPLTLCNVKQRQNKKIFDRGEVGSDGGELNAEYLAAEKFLDSFRLPEDRVDELNAACELSSWPDQQRYQITQISGRSWWSSVDDYGRYHSPFTNLSKNIRKYLSCDGQGVVGFDFANFQPALLTRQTITKIPDNEYKKYYSLCQRGVIYEHMAEECPRYKSRDEAKTDFLKMLNKKNQFMIQMELFKTFQVSFPRYADTVLKIKEDSHLEMTKFLQWHETQIMFGGIVRTLRTKTKSPFFTIHDAIYTPINQRNILRDVLKKIIIDYDIPTIGREEDELTTTTHPPIYAGIENTNDYSSAC